MKATLRICESVWHKPVDLMPFEKCPICNSKASHDVRTIECFDNQGTDF
jgi:hypothetical protein